PEKQSRICVLRRPIGARVAAGYRRSSLRSADFRRAAVYAVGKRRCASDPRLRDRTGDRTVRKTDSPDLMNQSLHNPIIIALDVGAADAARALIQRIGPRVNFYKVGLELYAATGIGFVRELVEEGKQIFLDFKFYDIPETVSRAVARVAESGAR